jgi:hypothetical protein
MAWPRQEEGDKFYPIKIVTQGYDYPIPGYSKNFGLNPLLWYVPFIRSFLGHGRWLKTLLQMRGINNPLNDWLPSGFVSHIDSRDTVGVDGWTDELHPKPVHFINTGKVFTGCIKNSIAPTYKNVFVVKGILSRWNIYTVFVIVLFIATILFSIGQRIYVNDKRFDIIGLKVADASHGAAIVKVWSQTPADNVTTLHYAIVNTYADFLFIIGYALGAYYHFLLPDAAWKE